ncbi:unnamed protein product, partial [Didymodactylos carnosus]
MTGYSSHSPCDETLCDELSTLNSSSNETGNASLLMRTVNVQYISREYILRNGKNHFIRPSQQCRKTPTSSCSVLVTTSSSSSSPEKIQTSGNMTDVRTINAPENISISSKNFIDLNPRNVAIIELITTEQRFVHDMNSILEMYIIPMQECEILTSSHVDALFVNWRSLTRCHEKLVNTLLSDLKTDGDALQIGDILCQFLPQLIVEYEVYFRFHHTSVKCFRDSLNNCIEFRTFMQKTKRNSYGIGTFGDANILTLPLQRVAKYPFMISQILKGTTSDHKDISKLRLSLEKSNELRKTVNDALGEEMNRTKFEWIQKHVDCKKINEAKSSRLLYAMLFSDFLLLTRIKRPL